MKRILVPFVLFISAVPRAAAAAPEPAIVSPRDWGSRPGDMSATRRQTPAWITIHHAGEKWTAKSDAVKFLCDLQSWGQSPPDPPRKAVWPDLPYHYLIAPDGRIFGGRPVEYAGETNTRFDVAGNIGVELMGDFEVQRPSPAQLRSLVRLVAWLSRRYGIGLDHVRGHMEALEPAAKDDPVCRADPSRSECVTDCPGRDVDRYLKDGRLRAWLEAAVAGRDPAVAEETPLPGGPASPIPTAPGPGVTPWTRCP